MSYHWKQQQLLILKMFINHLLYVICYMLYTWLKCTDSDADGIACTPTQLSTSCLSLSDSLNPCAFISSSVNPDNKNTHFTGLIWGLSDLIHANNVFRTQQVLCEYQSLFYCFRSFHKLLNVHFLLWGKCAYYHFYRRGSEGSEDSLVS